MEFAGYNNIAFRLWNAKIKNRFIIENNSFKLFKLYHYAWILLQRKKKYPLFISILSNYINYNKLSKKYE